MKKRFPLLISILAIFILLVLAGCSASKNISTPVATSISPTAQTGSPQVVPVVSSGDETPGVPASGNYWTALPFTSKAEPLELLAVPAGSEQPTAQQPGVAGETLPPDKWQDWPVVPVISSHALDIYRAGIAQGNNPQHFSKVGDCQNIRQYFLGLFDKEDTYRLGEQYAYLQETINYYSGNWFRLSEAVRTGFNVASVLAPLYANPEDCQPNETPLACEVRIWNPSFVIISMETWTPDRPVQAYEDYLRQIVEYALSKNILPVLATKADNLEGNDAINQIVARVAADYDIPMWNFWAAAHPLTNQGLEDDRFHLTNGPNYYDDPKSLDLGWPVRNLTALLTIDAVWKAVR